MKNQTEGCIKVTLQPGTYIVTQPTTVLLPPETSAALAGDEVTSLLTCDRREAKRYYSDYLAKVIPGKSSLILGKGNGPTSGSGSGSGSGGDNTSDGKYFSSGSLNGLGAGSGCGSGGGME